MTAAQNLVEQYGPQYKQPIKKTAPGRKKGTSPVTKKAPPAPPEFEAFKYIDTAAQALMEAARMPDVSDATCIKDLCCRLLVAVNGTVTRESKEWKVGFSFDSILRTALKKFPTANTTEKALRWYLVRMRQDEKGWDTYHVPTRFERPKTRTVVKSMEAIRMLAAGRSEVDIRKILEGK